VRTKLGLTVAIFLIIFSAAPVNGQQKGQYIPGQQGLNAGLLPDPGFTYANLTINYSADTLKNANGNTVPLTGSYDIWAIANVFFYVPKFKFLGAKLAFMVAPTLANGSLTLGSLRFPNIRSLAFYHLTSGQLPIYVRFEAKATGTQLTTPPNTSAARRALHGRYLFLG
jgi:hypothetical protein